MDKIEREQLYKTAWKHWGADMQQHMLIEEMAELTVAILHAHRDKTLWTEDVIEELADVSICFEQHMMRMKTIPSGSAGTVWDRMMVIRERKLQRMYRRTMDSICAAHPDAGEEMGSGR